MALPAAWATTPKMEKMPAPTMPPMPMAMAASRPIFPRGGLSVDWRFIASGLVFSHAKTQTRKKNLGARLQPRAPKFLASWRLGALA